MAVNQIAELSKLITLAFAKQQHVKLRRFQLLEDAFAVNLPPDESDLTPTDPAAAVTQAGLPADHLTVAATPAQLEASVRRSRYGAEVWRPLLWVLIPLLFLESLLAQRFGRRG